MRFNETPSSSHSSNLARTSQTSVDVAGDNAGLGIPLARERLSHLVGRVEHLVDALPLTPAAAWRIGPVEDFETLRRLRGHCSSSPDVSPSWPLSSTAKSEA